MSDEFTYETIKPGRVRFLTAVAGFSHAGKTVSAARLLKGAQRVYGGDVCVIDSEEAFGMYQEDFPEFKHIPLAPPHSADRWMRALDFAYSKGARCFLLDTLSDEHIALMERVDVHLDRMAGDDWKKRERCMMAAHGKADVKPLRQKFERRLWELSKTCAIVVTYRADEKFTPPTKKDGGPAKEEDSHTWKLGSTSKLLYSCTLRWLLKPGSDGVPTLTGGNDAERMMIKVPAPFRKLQMAKQLDETLGEQIARECKGAKPAAARGLMFNRSYGYESTSNPSGTVNDATPAERATYLHWLGQREVPANARAMFETHLAAVTALVESDRAEAALSGEAAE